MKWSSRLLRVLVVALAPLAGALPAQANTAPPDETLLPAPVSPTTPPGPDGLGLLEVAQPLTTPSGDFNPLSILAGASEAFSSAPEPAGRSKGGLAAPINIVIIITVIGLVPSIMLMTTSFIRIIVVLGLLKQALGTQQLPPPQVIVGLTFFMTLLVMKPTIDRINTEAVAPYRQGQIADYDVLWAKASAPLKDFMLDQIEATGNWSSLYMILNYRGIDTSAPEKLTRDDVDMVSLVPSYVLSELKTAFLMGFRVYLPFLVIDMVIASLLISMSMMMLPPVLISLPFKLLLFVLVDGWQLVVSGLLTSFVSRNPSAVALLEPARAYLGLG